MVWTGKSSYMLSRTFEQPIRSVCFGPEAVLFTFSKMAAGMYLEHYLDSKMIAMRQTCRKTKKYSNSVTVVRSPSIK